MRYPVLFILILACGLSGFALEPQVSRKGALLFEDDFSSGREKPEWSPLHGTRWTVKQGAYVGSPSPSEFQAARKHHKGTTPGMALRVPARDCILRMSFKISGGLNAVHFGFNNGTTAAGTGHINRLILSTNQGALLQKDSHSRIPGDKDTVLATADWNLQKDRWYTLLIEAIGDRLVARVEGGPTLEARHWRFDQVKTWVNLKCRGKNGELAYDDVKIWEALPADGQRKEAGAVWKRHDIIAQVEGDTQTDSAVAADFDGDGFVDVIGSFAGGVVLLRGPDWERHTLHVFSEKDSVAKPRPRCIHSCLLDVDGDGDPDFIGSNNTTFWLECPDDPFSGKPWKFRTIDDEIRGTHCLITGDVNRDGKLDLIANSNRTREMTPVHESICWFETPTASTGWIRHIFADKDAPGANHYMGMGDLNGDGRPDIACGAKGGDGFPGGEWFAWWEQPADGSVPWKKHLLSDREPGASNILPADVNRDGHMDLVAARGHGQGICVFMGPDFKKVEIDTEIQGPHSLFVEDLDQDGDVDLGTCGRHEDSIAAWYENDGRGNFTRHLIEENQGSYDTRAVDMDGDGDLDMLIAGHWTNNLVWFENPMRGK